MRKIEKQMLAAVQAGKAWHSANTAVSIHVDARGFGHPNVFLHGNHIATVENGVCRVNEYTLRQWPSSTTKSRLRALGANVTTRKGLTYLDGRVI